MQAFPRPSSEARDAMGNTFWPPAREGMTLRDWFAGQALAGGHDVAVCYELADKLLEKRELSQ